MTVSLRLLAVGVILGGVACGQSSAPTSTSSATQATVPAATTPSAVAQTPSKKSIQAFSGPVDGVLAEAAAPELVTVFVKLDGNAVAVERAKQPGIALARSDEESMVESMVQQQNRVIPAIQAMGGNVLHTFKYAVNGIKVSIAANKIPSLLSLPGVLAVKNVQMYERLNSTSVPAIGTPAVWNGDAHHPGFHGEGIRLGIIDTGVDFTHANFGGPGTVAAFTAASAASTLPADPALFGPGAPKVKGGTDLVGDAYTGGNTPVPDSNPLDCSSTTANVGHGSHVSGTATGFGVNLDGSTYTGPYDSTTPSHPFLIGPGVAPKADLYFIRVFGCSGGTNVVTEALEWGVEHNLQILSMSLGDSFGSNESSDAEASANASAAGVIVVAAAGNAGPTTFITGSPSTGDRTVSVAAMDSHTTFPGAILTLTPGTITPNPITVQNSNNGAIGPGALSVYVVPDSGSPAVGVAGVGLGCNDADYPDALVAGKLVVTARGVCARVQRLQLGFKHGAAAVAMINTAAGFPVFEGNIHTCGDGGLVCGPTDVPTVITNPFYGLNGATATTLSPSEAALVAAATASAVSTINVNPTGGIIASFSSAGPRSSYNDNGVFSPGGHLKPDISGPGVSIVSTASGTGSGAETLSGTSMATPHVAGVAALALQSHPFWDPDDVRIAMVNSADPSKVAVSSTVAYDPIRIGSGLVQPLNVTRTAIVVRGDTGDEGNLSFGTADLLADFNSTRNITITNLGTQRTTLNITSTASSVTRPHTITVTPSTITLAGGSTARLKVSLSVPVATAGAALTAANTASTNEISGYLKVAPTAGGNNGVSSIVPYLLMSHARSQLSAAVRAPFGPTHPASSIFLENDSNAVGAGADFYAWGGGSGNATVPFGVRAIGVQSLPPFGSMAATDKLLVFAVNINKPIPTVDQLRYDVNIYLNGHTAPDFTIRAQDTGLFANPQSITGQSQVTIINNTVTPKTTRTRFLTTGTIDGTIAELPVRASDLGLTPTGVVRFKYDATVSFIFENDTTPLNNFTDSTPVAAFSFNPFTPAIDNGMFDGLDPFGQDQFGVSINPTEFALTPARGFMIVNVDNPVAGANNQALLLSVAQH